MKKILCKYTALYVLANTLKRNALISSTVNLNLLTTSERILLEPLHSNRLETITIREEIRATREMTTGIVTIAEIPTIAKEAEATMTTDILKEEVSTRTKVFQK